MTSEQLVAKSISIKGQVCRSGRCAGKATELTWGDLRRVRKPKRTHHALQLDADECEWDDQKRAWHICHNGRMSQVPRETVMEAVREAQTGSWIDTYDKGRERISLGTLPDADSATWRNSRNLLANLIHYAIIRTNPREARSR